MMHAILKCLTSSSFWQTLQWNSKGKQGCRAYTRSRPATGTSLHSEMKRHCLSPETMCLRSDSPPITTESPRSTDNRPTEQEMSPQTRSKTARKLTLLTDVSRVSPCSVVTLAPVLVESTYARSTVFSRVCDFVEDAYVQCCSNGMFHRSSAPIEDTWGIVIATQSILNCILPEIGLLEDLSSIIEQPIYVRRLMAAVLLMVMSFHKSRGIAISIYCSQLGTQVPGNAAVYYSLFLAPQERTQLAQSSPSIPQFIRRMSCELSFQQVEVMNRIPRIFCHMGRSVLNLTEESLWQRLQHFAQEQFHYARSVAVFLIRAAAREAPELVLTPEDSIASEAVALAAVCAITQAPISERLPTESVRHTAIRFVSVTLAIPLSAKWLYVGRFAAGGLLNKYVEPLSLGRLLSTLRISQHTV